MKNNHLFLCFIHIISLSIHINEYQVLSLLFSIAVLNLLICSDYLFPFSHTICDHKVPVNKVIFKNEFQVI